MIQGVNSKQVQNNSGPALRSHVDHVAHRNPTAVMIGEAAEAMAVVEDLTIAAVEAIAATVEEAVTLEAVHRDLAHLLLVVVITPAADLPLMEVEAVAEIAAQLPTTSANNFTNHKNIYHLFYLLLMISHNRDLLFVELSHSLISIFYLCSIV